LQPFYAIPADAALPLLPSPAWITCAAALNFSVWLVLDPLGDGREMT
jgi:tryptophan-rich sensory protein